MKALSMQLENPGLCHFLHLVLLKPLNIVQTSIIIIKKSNHRYMNIFMLFAGKLTCVDKIYIYLYRSCLNIYKY